MDRPLLVGRYWQWLVIIAASDVPIGRRNYRKETIMSFLGWFKRHDEENEPEENSEEEWRMLTSEETDAWLASVKQSEAYAKYQAIKDGTYREKYGE